MDSNIVLREKLNTRDRTIDKLINRLNLWDETAESGIDIIEKNKRDIEDLKSIEKSLGSDYLLNADEKYIEKINILLEGEKEILANLQKRRKEVENIMKQLNNKDKIKDSYLKQNKSSLFIDRDF